MKNSLGAFILLIPSLACLGTGARTATQSRVPPSLTRVQDPGVYQNVHNTLTSEEEEQGWKLLFDGKTTNGWRGFRQQTTPGGWQVVDGALTRVDGGGDLITGDQYDSFELYIEWKVAAGGNSGIMFRVSEAEEET